MCRGYPALVLVLVLVAAVVCVVIVYTVPIGSWLSFNGQVASRDAVNHAHAIHGTKIKQDQANNRTESIGDIVGLKQARRQTRMALRKTIKMTDSAERTDKLQKLSHRLNSLQEKLQQQVCLKEQWKKTTQTGGWCNDTKRFGRYNNTDTKLAIGLGELFKGHTVVSLGDGLGTYRDQLLKAELIPKFDAFDGAPFINKTTKGQVGFLDLTLPQYWLPKYDWVLCLEVLQFIRAKSEPTVLNNLVRAARTGIVLSWASPGRKGYLHVNQRPSTYVIRVMNKRGFEEDKKATEELRGYARFFWFRLNTFVFRRKEKGTASTRITSNKSDKGLTS